MTDGQILVFSPATSSLLLDVWYSPELQLRVSID